MNKYTHEQTQCFVLHYDNNLKTLDVTYKEFKFKCLKDALEKLESRG